jgi:hypothetical protein
LHPGSRAAEYVEKRKLAGKPTPLPAQLPVRFVEVASKEDDANMPESWARLLANAADPSRAFDIDRTHMTILSEMTPLDAKILAYFPTQGWFQKASIAQDRVLDCDNIANALHQEKSHVAVSIGNLWRLGCLLQDPT